MGTPLNVLIASPLEPELVDRIGAVAPGVEVLFAPELLPRPRYAADHSGTPVDLSDDQHRTWSSMLAAADVSFDFDWRAPAELPATAPRLRWVQATSAGIGQFLQRTGLDSSTLTFTTAAGVHAVPLAEFALTGLLYFMRGVPHLRAMQAARHWERYAATSARGRRALVVGLGSIGRETCALLAGAGLEVWGVGRPGRTYDVPSASRVIDTDALDDALPHADAVVLACPLTKETSGLLSRARLALLPPGAVLVNVSRGQVVDEPALIDALEDGRLGGAALDVFAVEPLPVESPLWAREDVLVSPHSASTLASENAAIVDLFCDNLRRFLDGRPLRNLYRPDDGY
jgi:glyoxylate/hydroxypyruvate reductase